MYGGTAAKLRSLFHGRKFLNLLKTVGQAVPEIPLSKLELLLSLQISIYFPVHSRICPRMHIAMYNILYVYISYNTMYMTEAPRVFHFCAFITKVGIQAVLTSRSVHIQAVPK